MSDQQNGSNSRAARGQEVSSLSTQKRPRKTPTDKIAAAGKRRPRQSLVKQWMALSFNQRLVSMIAAIGVVATTIYTVIYAVSYFSQERDIPRIEVERATMTYDPVGGRRLEARCFLHNASKTAIAKGMTVDISIEGRSTPLPAVTERLNPPNRSKMDLAPDGRIVVPVPGKEPGIRSDSADAIRAGKITVFVYGFIDYADRDGKPYTTEFWVLQSHRGPR
jgi:hypothetical protein